MALSLTMASLLLMAGEGQNKEVGFTKADLSRAVLDAEAALKTASVTCDYTIQHWRWGKGGLSAPVHQHGVCTFDSLGRCRYEGSGEIPDASGTRVYFEKHVGVFDGRRMKRMEGNRERYLRGVVNERPVLPWPMDPREYLYHFRSKRVANEIAEEDSRIVGWVPWNGRRAIAVESKIYVEENGQKLKRRVFIDPERGFAVVRRMFASYRPGSGDWVDDYVVEGSDYSEIVPGVWLPGRVTWIQGGSSKEQKSVFAYMEVRNSNWTVNGKLPDSTFDLKFEPAIVVTDQQSGKTYQTVEVRDGQIARQVSEGMEIYKEKSPVSWKKIALWVTIGLVSFAGLALALFRVRKARRPSLP